MNNNFFKKGLFYTFISVLLLISFIFCFCCGYYLRRDRFLDTDTVSASSFNLLDIDVSPCGVDILENDSYPYNDYLYFSSLDFYLTKLDSTIDWTSHDSEVFPLRFYLSLYSMDFYFGNYNNGRFDYYNRIVPSVDDGWHYDYLDPYGIGEYIRVQYRIQSDFDFSSISLCYLTRVNEWGNNTWFNYHIDLYDVNNHNYRLILFYHPSEFDVMSWSDYFDRPLYFVLGGEVLNNNVIYQQGYNDGYSVGNQVGLENGYQTGSIDGQTVGYNNGYSHGLNDANTYSFGNLFAALFDAPVVMVYNALDFELLGVNLYAFFCGLITVFLCIALIKFIRGK